MNQINFEQLNLSFLQENNNQMIQINKDGLDIYFHIHLVDSSKKLVVFSNGAVDPSVKKPPLFMRSSWSEEMPYNAIFIDDRTIHGNDLRLGWGVGTRERHFLLDYSEIVKKINELLEIQNSNTYYYGSSAGGFMSIALATVHKDSIAIVNNPQTFVYRYYEKAVDALFNAVFSGLSKVEIQKNYALRLSLTAMIKHYKNTPKIYYFQNRLCNFDMENHYQPFVQMLDKYKTNSEPITFIFYNDKKNGHNPLSKEKTLNYIKKIVDGQLEF